MVTFLLLYNFHGALAHSLTAAHRTMPQQARPAFDPISVAPPTDADMRHEKKLLDFMSKEVPSASHEMERRTHILATLTALFENWVCDVCLDKGLPPELARTAGGAIYTSGSYRLGISEKGMDIDTICVAPRHVTRDDFFNWFQGILEDHDSVENLIGIETAMVPLITFDFDGINIDLLFASLPVDSIPKDTFDIDDDNVLRGVDRSTEMTLNGPRVTNMIPRLVSSTESFLKLVSCIRLWAKRRGLYSNKMGYLGGVNCNILAAFICQLYPNAAAPTLLERFYYILSTWQWPTPISLVPSYDAGLGFEPWDCNVGGNRYHVMPVLTPAYPSMNSMHSVSAMTLEIMQEEMGLALERVRTSLSCNGEGWDAVFAPTDFPVSFSRYLAAEIFVSNLPEHLVSKKYHIWSGYIESKLRKLVETLSYLPVARLRLLPKKLPLISKVAQEQSQGGEGASYLIGFDIDLERMQGEQLNLTYKVEEFKWNVLYQDAARSKIIDDEFTHKQLRFRVVDFPSWRDLPDAAFEALGGRDKAKALRKQITKERKRAEAEAAGKASDETDAAPGSKRPADGTVGEAESTESGGPAAKSARAEQAQQEDEAVDEIV